MLGAGQRSHRVRFERRALGQKSASGNLLQAWAALFPRWAGFRPQFGGERLEQGRMDSTMRGTLTVLACPDTRGLTAADRVVFLAGPYRETICIIRSILPTPDASEIEMTIETSTEN